MPLLCALPIPLSSMGNASSQDEQKYAGGNATDGSVRKQQGKPLCSDAVPVVETETDIARCQST